MKKTAVLAVAITLASSLWAGTLTYGGDAVSRYVWRGIDFGDPVSYEEPTTWQNNTPAIQPGFTYTFDNGISLGLWGSYGIGKNASNEIDELDFIAGYVFKIADIDAKIGYTHYTFPSYATALKRLTTTKEKYIVANTDSDELAFGLTFSKVALAPSITIYSDYDQNAAVDDLTQYTYTELGLTLPELAFGLTEGVVFGFDGTARTNGGLTNINYKLSKALDGGLTAYSNVIYTTGKPAGTGVIMAKEDDGKRDPVNNDNFEVVFGLNYTGSLSL